MKKTQSQREAISNNCQAHNDRHFRCYRMNTLCSLTVLLAMMLITKDGVALAFMTKVRTLNRSHTCYSSKSMVMNMNNRIPDESVEEPNGKKRRKKKNKYAKFSKTGEKEEDPWEQMVIEAEQKVKDLELEREERKNRLPANARISKEEKRSRNKMEFPSTSTIDPYDPSTYGFTELGTIIGPHGVNGFLKIMANTDFGHERLCTPGTRHLKPKNRRSPREIRLLDGKPQLNGVFIIQLEGVGDRNNAKGLTGSVLYAKETERPMINEGSTHEDDADNKEEEEDEYLIRDLVGLEVFLEQGYQHDNNDEQSPPTAAYGALIGIIHGIVLAEDMCGVKGLGNDLLEITLPKRIRPNGPYEKVLIPFVPEIVTRVDVLGRAVHMNPPKGLLDLTYVTEKKVRIRGFLPPARDEA